MISEIINELTKIHKAPKVKEFSIDVRGLESGLDGCSTKDFKLEENFILKDVDNIKVTLKNDAWIVYFYILDTEVQGNKTKIISQPYIVIDGNYVETEEILTRTILKHIQDKYIDNLVIIDGIVKFKDKKIEKDFITNIAPVVDAYYYVNTGEAYYTGIVGLEDSPEVDNLVTILETLLLLGDFKCENGKYTQHLFSKKNGLITGYKLGDKFPKVKAMRSGTYDVEQDIALSDLLGNKYKALQNYRMLVMEIESRDDGTYKVSYYDNKAKWVSSTLNIFDTKEAINLLKRSELFLDSDLKGLSFTKEINTEDYEDE